MNKVFTTVFAVLLLVALFLANAGISPVAAAATTAAVTTYRPRGNTYTTKPIYSWSKVGTTANYKLQVYDIAAARYRINTVVSNLSCGATTNRCSFKSNTFLANNRSYKWRVAAGKGAFSAWKTFKVLPGFNSQFNNNAAGWVLRPGAAWSTSGGTTIHTTGAADKWSSISYNKSFNNFTYSARMKRISTTGAASGFWVRGTPTFDPIYNSVQKGYLFLYSQNGCFSVWKHVNGVVTAKKVWTLSASINSNDWNTLKVIADVGALRFYINNVLVWTGSDASFKTGQVALTMYSVDSTVERLDVDWAKLGMSDLYKSAVLDAADEILEEGQLEILFDPSQPYGPEQAPAVP